MLLFSHPHFSDEKMGAQGARAIAKVLELFTGLLNLLQSWLVAVTPT
jgi:hypothetical protein